ncbi:MAG: hypothetical protein AAF501_10550 [Pseudomonadota bacterium]
MVYDDALSQAGMRMSLAGNPDLPAAVKAMRAALLVMRDGTKPDTASPPDAPRDPCGRLLPLDRRLSGRRQRLARLEPAGLFLGGAQGRPALDEQIVAPRTAHGLLFELPYSALPVA